RRWWRNERRHRVLARNLDRNIDRKRPRLRLEHERKADDADAEQDDRTDQPPPGASSRLLHGVGRRKRGGSGIALLLEHRGLRFGPNARVLGGSPRARRPGL